MLAPKSDYGNELAVDSSQVVIRSWLAPRFAGGSVATGQTDIGAWVDSCHLPAVGVSTVESPFSFWRIQLGNA
jgi:hypothetical protein